jgi:hypothetical protein
MLGLLMVDENFQVIEVTLTVVAPWPREHFIQIRVIPLLLGHLDNQLLVSTNLSASRWRI